MSGRWEAKSCGAKTAHAEHIWVGDGTSYACFGYTPPAPVVEPERDEDDLAFARETLGPDATDDEVHNLADLRLDRDEKER